MLAKLSKRKIAYLGNHPAENAPAAVARRKIAMRTLDKTAKKATRSQPGYGKKASASLRVKAVRLAGQSNNLLVTNAAS